MTLFVNSKKHYLSLDELDSETFALVKAYRDFKVILTGGMLNSLNLRQLRQRFETFENYLKIFQLPMPMYSTKLHSDMRYAGSTICFDEKSCEIFIFDMYAGTKTFKIAFGNETVLKNSLSAPFDYDDKTDFKEVFDLLKKYVQTNF